MDIKKKDKILITVFLIFLAITGMYRKQREEPVSFAEIPEESRDESDDENADEDCAVYITGEVLNPGVYSVRPGDRLENVVKKAGGFTDNADPDVINLAKRMEDEMKIHIPAIGEVSIAVEEETGKVNIATATVDELTDLPGIGPKKAEAIINFREESGFQNPEDLMHVPGIGEKTYEQLKEMIEVR